MKCGVRLEALPSLTGSDAKRLEEYLPRLPSREEVEAQVEGVLGELSASREPVVVLLVAEWGEGKTSIYRAKVKPWLEERGWVAAEVRAAALMGYVEELRRRVRDKAPEYLLVAALFAALNEEQPMLVPSPSGYRSARDYVAACIRRLSRVGPVMFFVDEFEDVVTAGDEEAVGIIVAGLVGLVNGGVEPVSVSCVEKRVEPCRPGSLHVMLALTPPAYSKLMGFRDFATVASRLKRRVRSIHVKSLTRRESLLFIKALARYSFGEAGLRGFLSSPSLANALASAGLGNMGALVSAFRAVAGYAERLGEGVCGGKAALLTPRDLLRVLRGLQLSIGGAELPALNEELYSKLTRFVEARARLSGLNTAAAAGFIEALVAQHVMVDGRWGRLVAELNEAAEGAWVRRELGVRRLVYRVRLVDAEEAYKAFMAAAEEASKTMPRLARVLLEVGDQVTHIAPDGSLRTGIPGRGELVDLIMDASPVDLSEQEAEALASVLAGRLEGLGGADAVMLSPKLAKTLYVSPELSYLDFIADRLERLRVNRRVYTEADESHLVAASVAALSAAYRLEGEPSSQAGWARLTLYLHVSGRREAAVNTLVAATRGGLTPGDVERLERTIMTCILANWRPHLVILVHYGPADQEAVDELKRVEEKYFVKVLRAQIPTMVMRVRMAALGIKILDAAGSMDEALRLAARLPHGAAGEIGLDQYRLEGFLDEVREELFDPDRVRKALAEGVAGKPLLVTDPRLAYDVERPSELAGALRYYLVVPSPKASPRDALEAAYEYVMRYHVYRRGGGPDPRGILSPDIDRREVSTLERYTALLIANRMLERLNGEMKIDTLSPQEQALLEALRQAGAEKDWVAARQAWRFLVDATQNPGTRRMLLQLLAYRGLVEVQGRRIDPDKSRVRIRGVRELREKISELERVLDDLSHDPDAGWAYIVSAKLRGYRAGCLRGLVEKARALLETAREALRARDHLMAARLVKTVEDLLSYYQEEVMERLVRPAAKAARTLARMVRERLEELEEFKRIVEEQASGYVFDEPVTLRLDAVEALREAVKAIGRIESMEMTEEELDERVADMWRRALTRNPREPGRETPFYIGGMGPSIMFNYKLWLVTEELSRLGVVKAPGSLELGGAAAATLERLKQVAATLRECLEQYNRLAGEIGALADRLASLGVKAPAALHAEPPRLHPRSSVLSLDELEGYIGEWRRMLDRVTASLRAAEEMLNRLERAAKAVRDAAARLEELAGVAEGEAGRAECIAPGLARALLEEAGRARRLAEEAMDKLSIVVEPDADSVARAADELSDTARKLEEEAGRLEELIRRAREAVAGEYERMKTEYAALAAALRRPPTPPRDACRLAAELEKLREEVVKAGVLTGEEVEVYLGLERLKKRHGELLLSKACTMLAEALGRSAAEVRRVIIRLIERGVVEPKL